MVKNVEVKTQGIIARNEVQISRPGKSFCGKNNREGLEGVVGPKPLTIHHLRKQSKIGYNTMGNVVIEGNS